MEHLEIVTDTQRCCEIVDQLLKREFVAVNGEGVNMGYNGPMTLITIYTDDDKAFLFDIHEENKLFSDGRLKEVFESSAVKKVFVFNLLKRRRENKIVTKKSIGRKNSKPSKRSKTPLKRI